MTLSKHIRKTILNYPKSEREDDTISDAEEKNRKEVIIEEMFGKPSVPTEGNYIVEGMYGRPKYYIDGDLIRQNNQFGKVVCRKKEALIGKVVGRMRKL